MSPSLARRQYPDSQLADTESLAMFADDSSRSPQSEELPQALLPQPSKVQSSIATFRQHVLRLTNLGAAKNAGYSW